MKPDFSGLCPRSQLAEIRHNQGMMPFVPPGEMLPERISQIVSGVFPKRRLHSLRILEGGKTDSNVLVQIENCDDLFVFRRHLRGMEACRKEVFLLQALQHVLPVPEVIDADIAGEKSGTMYLLYRYVPGQRFREIRNSGSSRDMTEAAFAIGRALSVLEDFNASLLGDSGLLQRFGIYEDDLDSPVLRECLGADDWLLLQELHAKWLPVVQNLSNDGSLIHGDFNHRNILLKNRTGSWEVAGFLDGSLPAQVPFFGMPLVSSAMKGRTRSGGKNLLSKVFVQAAQEFPTIGVSFPSP